MEQERNLANFGMELRGLEDYADVTGPKLTQESGWVNIKVLKKFGNSRELDKII